MATLSVVYPRTPGATFDYDYYRSKHMPLVTQRWANAGLLGGEALLGMPRRTARRRRTSRSGSSTSIRARVLMPR